MNDEKNSIVKYAPAASPPEAVVCYRCGTILALVRRPPAPVEQGPGLPRIHPPISQSSEADYFCCKCNGWSHPADLVASPNAPVVDATDMVSKQTTPTRTDELIVQMWLAGKRSAKTKRVYAADARRLFEYFPGMRLENVRLEDLQKFAASLERAGLRPASRARVLAAIKSLFSFASDEGIRHVRYNVAAALMLPIGKDTINERILTKAQVLKIIAAAAEGRNRTMVELLYLVGLRAEELVNLCWRDVSADGAGGLGGVLTVFGKGSKTRHLKLEPAAWKVLSDWKCGEYALPERPIFASRDGGNLSTVQVWRIVSDAAKRAGINKASPHWLRHSHATHAMQAGCDVRVLQKSMGHQSLETTEGYIHARPKQSSGAFVDLEGSDGKPV